MQRRTMAANVAKQMHELCGRLQMVRAAFAVVGSSSSLARGDLAWPLRHGSIRVRWGLPARGSTGAGEQLWGHSLWFSCPPWAS